MTPFKAFWLFVLGWFFWLFYGNFFDVVFLVGFVWWFFDWVWGWFFGCFLEHFWGTVGTYSLFASFCNIFPRSNVSNIFAIFILFTFFGTTKSVYYNIVVVFVLLSNTLLIFPNTFILLARGSENIWFCWRLT